MYSEITWVLNLSQMGGHVPRNNLNDALQHTCYHLQFEIKFESYIWLAVGEDLVVVLMFSRYLCLSYCFSSSSGSLKHPSC